MWLMCAAVTGIRIRVIGLWVKTRMIEMCKYSLNLCKTLVFCRVGKFDHFQSKILTSNKADY